MFVDVCVSVSMFVCLSISIFVCVGVACVGVCWCGCVIVAATRVSLCMYIVLPYVFLV